MNYTVIVPFYNEAKNISSFNNELINNLKKINDISFVYLTEKDVVRHFLVQKIVKAYDK